MPEQFKTTAIELAPPSWARDYLEGLEWEAKRIVQDRMEEEMPGVWEAFEELVGSLPESMSGGSEFPVAAAVVRRGEDGKVEVLARAQNRVNELNDSTRHAEQVVLEDAQKITGKHLRDCTLLTTLCPCGQCAGASINTEVKRVVFGARQSDVRGKHAVVGGEHKPYRTVDPSRNTAEELRQVGIEVLEDYNRGYVLSTLQRVHGGWASYYSDPDN